MKEIARESGYSVSTLSRALNNHINVSAQVKGREIVTSRRFVPTSNARQRKQQQSQEQLILVKAQQPVFLDCSGRAARGYADEL